MMYELVRVKDHFQLVAIRDVPREASSTVEILSSSESSSSAQPAA